VVALNRPGTTVLEADFAAVTGLRVAGHTAPWEGLAPPILRYPTFTRGRVQSLEGRPLIEAAICEPEFHNLGSKTTKEGLP
jgi:hypothetical protein